MGGSKTGFARCKGGSELTAEDAAVHNERRGARHGKQCDEKTNGSSLSNELRQNDQREPEMKTTISKDMFGPWALITGASSGIGKEFARQIAASGINIVLVARREALLKEVGVEFSKRYGVAHPVLLLDVAPEDFIRQLASPPHHLHL